MYYFLFNKGIKRRLLNLKKKLFLQGSVVYSTELQDGLGVNNFDIPTIEKLCLICKRIANNTELVVPGGSQCVYYHYYGMQF